jgi:hypothetical protein
MPQESNYKDIVILRKKLMIQISECLIDPITVENVTSG